jgi:site-specific DNA-methyltransferase (adenine-specific)
LNRIETFAEGVTLYLGDCRDWLGMVPSCFRVHSLITDPPYGVNLGDQPDRGGDHILVKDHYASYEDTPANFAAVVVPAITRAISIADRGLVFVSGATAWMLPPPAGIGGVYLPSAQGRMIWGFRSFAPCLLYGQAPDLHLGCRATAMESSDVSERNGHPCPKPLSWMKWAAALASRRGEIILDPFMGSGTTGVAAVKLGRRFIGIEIEPKYYEIALRRISEALRQPDLFIEKPKPVKQESFL